MQQQLNPNSFGYEHYILLAKTQGSDREFLELMDIWKPLCLSTLAALVMACMATHVGAPLASVTIWNYVGEPILVHCHDQFTDLEQQHVPHDTDYVFTFYQNAEGTTLYSCSFVWGLNETQEFPVWTGEKVQTTNPREDCGAGMLKCLYKVSKAGFFIAYPALGHGNLSNWFLINLWKVKVELHDVGLG